VGGWWRFVSASREAIGAGSLDWPKRRMGRFQDPRHSPTASSCSAVAVILIARPRRTDADVVWLHGVRHLSTVISTCPQYISDPRNNRSPARSIICCLGTAQQKAYSVSVGAHQRGADNILTPHLHAGELSCRFTRLLRTFRQMIIAQQRREEGSQRRTTVKSLLFGLPLRANPTKAKEEACKSNI
jgi:hypothetical protein